VNRIDSCSNDITEGASDLNALQLTAFI